MLGSVKAGPLTLAAYKGYQSWKPDKVSGVSVGHLVILFVPDWPLRLQETITLRGLMELGFGTCWGTVPTVYARAGRQSMPRGLAIAWAQSDIATCVHVSMTLVCAVKVMT